MDIFKRPLGIYELENRVKSLEERLEVHENAIKNMSDQMKIQSYSIVALTETIKKLIFSVKEAKYDQMLRESSEEEEYN